MAKSATVVATGMQRVGRMRAIATEENDEKKRKERAEKNHDFVQLSRSAMLDFAGLIRRSPAAAQVLIVIANHMGTTNYLQAKLQDLRLQCGVSRATMDRAIKLLVYEGWIRRDEDGKTVGYTVNAGAFWTTYGNLKGSKGVFWASISVPRKAGEPPGKVSARSVKVLSAKAVPRKRAPAAAVSGVAVK